MRAVLETRPTRRPLGGLATLRVAGRGVLGPVVATYGAGGDPRPDAIARTDCAAIGESCVAGDSACRPAETSASGCGSLDFHGECPGSGDVLRWCQDGSVSESDCSLDGRVCAWRDSEVGFDCIDAMSSTAGGCLDSEFTCNDGVCIATSALCDCSRDCADGEDEVGCGDCPTL